MKFHHLRIPTIKGPISIWDLSYSMDRRLRFEHVTAVRRVKKQLSVEERSAAAAALCE